MLLIINGDGVWWDHNMGRLYSYGKTVCFNKWKQTFFPNWSTQQNIPLILSHIHTCTFADTQTQMKIEFRPWRLRSSGSKDLCIGHRRDVSSFQTLSICTLQTPEMWRDFFFFFSRRDYIPHTHMLAQTYCRKIHFRAYFILGRAGINVKIWVWQLKKTDAQALYCCSLSCSCSSCKIAVNNIADGVNQLLWVLEINQGSYVCRF